jgi:riboflavin kinase/FMN adenylyltransferase
VATLAENGAQYGFTALSVPAQKLAQTICSSTHLRELLQQVEIANVNAMLGRNYQLQGRVVHGDGRGAKIGFATANIGLNPQLLLPRNGVYAVRLQYADRWHNAVANLGVQPSFAGQNRRLEVHLLNGEHALYGQFVQVEFIALLRAEQKFASLPELQAQIGRDCIAAQQLLETT